MGDRASKESILRDIASAGLTGDDLRLLMRRANWTWQQVSEAAVDADWLHRLREAAMLPAAVGTVDAAMRDGGGPRAMLQLGYDGLGCRVPDCFAKHLAAWGEAPTNVILLGPTGAGKSLTALWLLVEHNLAERRVEQNVFHAVMAWSNSRCHWVRAIDLAAATSRFPLGKGEPPEISIARSARVLVLDDLGWEREQDTTVRDVLAARYDTGRITIVTSGLTPEQLTARFGAAFVRRLRESNGARGIVLSAFRGDHPVTLERP